MSLISMNEGLNVLHDVVSITYLTHKARRVTPCRLASRSRVYKVDDDAASFIRERVRGDLRV